jgi:hypothetical protein
MGLRPADRLGYQAGLKHRIYSHGQKRKPALMPAQGIRTANQVVVKSHVVFPQQPFRKNLIRIAPNKIKKNGPVRLMFFSPLPIHAQELGFRHLFHPSPFFVK